MGVITIRCLSTKRCLL